MMIRGLQHERVQLVIVLLVTALLYLPLMRGGPITDDIDMFASSFSIRSLKDVKTVFQTGYTFEPQTEVQPADHRQIQTYRPVSISILLLLKGLFGANTVPFHLFNLLLHLSNIMLAALILKRLAPDSEWRFVALAFFAWHPYLLDAIGWINGLSDALVFFFLALALLARPLLLPGFLLALLCKETALMFLLVLPLVLRWQGERPRVCMLYTIAGTSVAFLLWGLRVTFLQAAPSAAGEASGYAFLAQYAYFVPWSMMRLLTLFDFNIVVRNLWIQQISLQSFFGWLGLAALLLGGAALYRQAWRSAQKQPGWMVLGAAIVYLLPAAYVHARFHAAPRMFYLPLFYFVAAVVCLVGVGRSATLYKRWRKPMVGVVVLLLIAAPLATAQRQRDYRSDEALMRADLRDNPHDYQAHRYYGKRLMLAGHLQEGCELLAQAMILAPDSLSALNNLAYCRYRLGDLQAAERTYLEILRRQPQHCNAQYHLGKIAQYRRQNRAAQEIWDKMPPHCRAQKQWLEP